MKKILILSFLLAVIGYNIKAQNISCNELLQAVVTGADHYSEVNNMALISSSFLDEVDAYEYEGVLFVVAKFKPKSGQFYGSTYIFCGVSKSNWNSFKNGFSGTYGERFHEYIRDYTCGCY